MALVLITLTSTALSLTSSFQKDASKTLTVKASTGLTSNGASSGTSIVATLDYDTNFEARGINGSDTVDTALGGANIDGRAYDLP
jgi:hypothetical protein